MTCTSERSDEMHQRNSVKLSLVCRCLGTLDNMTVFVEAVIPKHFDDSLWLKHFRIIKTAFEMVCNETVALFSPIIQSHDHDLRFLLYLFCACISIVVYVRLSASTEHVHLLNSHFKILCASWHFHPAFLMRFSNILIQIRGRKGIQWIRVILDIA